jgi:hypothetical protein
LPADDGRASILKDPGTHAAVITAMDYEIHRPAGNVPMTGLLVSDYSLAQL